MLTNRMIVDGLKENKAAVARQVLDVVASPIAIAAAGYTSNQGIQDARALNASSEKDQQKDDHSITSSTVSAVLGGYAAVRFLLTLPSAWQYLKWRDVAGIAVLAAGGAGGLGFGVFEFGHEQTTQSRAYSSALGAGFFNTATAIMDARAYIETHKPSEADDYALVDERQINDHAMTL